MLEKAKKKRGKKKIKKDREKVPGASLRDQLTQQQIITPASGLEGGELMLG